MPVQNAIKKQSELLVIMDSTLMPQGIKSGAAWIASVDAAKRERFLNDLAEGELLALPFLFEFWAHDHQLPPQGDWRTWVCIGGRGAGKTRAGAEWVRSQVEGARPLDAGQAKRFALVGETYDQVRDVMVFGDSGILAISPPDRRPKWEATRRRLVWPNGATATAYSASDPEALRGPQFDGAWYDELGSEEAILSTDFVTSIARNDVPLVMTRSEGQNVIKRWLHDAQLAKETVKFAAPLSQNNLQIGQLVAFSDTPDVTYRIDQIERDTYQIIQATRRDVLSLHPSDYTSQSAALKEQIIPLPVTAIWMDLPNQAMGLPSNQASVAMSARPWTSPAALYVDRGDQDWELEKVIGNQARIGRLLTSLDKGPIDRIDYGRTFEVELHDGQLSSKSKLAILSGANMAAIGTGTSTGWEILQFVDAELIAPNRYRLSGLVRGKFGTDAEMPVSWMPGDRFVMLDSALEGIPLNSSDGDAELRLLFGPTAAAVDSDVYQTQSYQHQNISARPLCPCHLRATISGSDLAVSWIRRGLKEADRWWDTEIPQLGEHSHYRIRLIQNEEVIAEQTSTSCDTVFTLSEGAILNAHLKVRVAQYSTEYGYGPDADCIVE